MSAASSSPLRDQLAEFLQESKAFLARADRSVTAWVQYGQKRAVLLGHLEESEWAVAEREDVCALLTEILQEDARVRELLRTTLTQLQQAIGVLARARSVFGHDDLRMRSACLLRCRA